MASGIDSGRPSDATINWLIFGGLLIIGVGGPAQRFTLDELFGPAIHWHLSPELYQRGWPAAFAQVVLGAALIIYEYAVWIDRHLVKGTRRQAVGGQ